MLRKAAGEAGRRLRAQRLHAVGAARQFGRGRRELRRRTSERNDAVRVLEVDVRPARSARIGALLPPAAPIEILDAERAIDVLQQKRFFVQQPAAADCAGRRGQG